MIKEDLIVKMTEFNAGDPKRIQHFLKVYEFAHVIGIRGRKKLQRFKLVLL